MDDSWTIDDQMAVLDFIQYFDGWMCRIVSVICVAALIHLCFGYCFVKSNIAISLMEIIIENALLN